MSVARIVAVLGLGLWLGCNPSDPELADADGSTDDDNGDDDLLCGNGTTDPGEDCDDGNTDDLDACSSTCELPGSTRWEDFYHGALMERDEGNDVAIDEFGNVYVTGWETVAVNENDILVRKYSPTGEALWTVGFDAIGVSWGEQGLAIEAIPGGDLILLARDYDLVNFDAANVRLMRLDPSGQPLFDVLYDGAAGLSDSATALAYDQANERVFVGGRQDVDAVDSAPWIGVFDANTGELLDERLVSEFGDGNLNRISAMAMLEDGRIGVVGSTYIEPTNDTSAWIGVIDDGFALAWEDILDVNGGYDGGEGVAAISGGMVVCATSEGETTDFDAWIRRYTLEGQEVWTVVHDNGMSLQDSCTDVAVDDADNIAVAGRSAIAATNPPTWTPRLAKYDSDGNLGWALDHTTHPDPDFISPKFFLAVAVGPDREIATVGNYSLGNDIVQVWVRVFAP